MTPGCSDRNDALTRTYYLQHLPYMDLRWSKSLYWVIVRTLSKSLDSVVVMVGKSAGTTHAMHEGHGPVEGNG